MQVFHVMCGEWRFPQTLNPKPLFSLPLGPETLKPQAPGSKLLKPAQTEDSQAL